MNDHEEFSDEEATVFECEDREAQMRKAKRCSDPRLRELALAALLLYGRPAWLLFFRDLI